jgi:hypothetical protein
MDGVQSPGLGGQAACKPAVSTLVAAPRKRRLCSTQHLRNNNYGTNAAMPAAPWKVCEGGVAPGGATTVLKATSASVAYWYPPARMAMCSSTHTQVCAAVAGPIKVYICCVPPACV